MKLTYNFAKKSLTVEGFDHDVPATCLVRNELNGLRRDDEVVRCTNEDGTDGLPYEPRTFPLGTWKVVNIADKTNPYEAPKFISTDAHQEVTVWTTKNGCYVHKLGIAEDYGYGLHHSTSATTLGCIRILALEDLEALAAAIQKAWSEHDEVTLDVIEE